MRFVSPESITARKAPHLLRSSAFDLSGLSSRHRPISNCNKAQSPFHGDFTDTSARKCVMTGLWIIVTAWMVCAAIAATVLGRVARRADSEELGSTLEWDIGTLDHEVSNDS